MNNFVAGLTGYAVIGVAVLMSNPGRKELREMKRDLNRSSNPLLPLIPSAPPPKYPLWKNIAAYTGIGLLTIALWPLFVTETAKEAACYKLPQRKDGAVSLNP
jgi:hypothetical protein